MSKFYPITLHVEMVDTEWTDPYDGDQRWADLPALFVNNREVWRAPVDTYTRDGDLSYVNDVIAELFTKLLNP